MTKRSAAGAGTIRKKTVTRNGKEYTFWEARITIGKDGGNGKQLRKSFSGKTQSEVRKAMTAALRELDNGTYTVPSKMTVGAWLDQWIETYCKNTVKPLTVSSYESSIRNHIKPQIGAIQLQVLRGVQVQQLYNTMLEKGSSPKTVKNTAAILHKALSVAVKQGFIVANPCDAAELPKARKTEIKPLTDAEIPLFLDAIEGDPFCNAYALCLFAGLREGECLGLSWNQVDFENRRITISQQLQESKEDGQFYIAPSTKSGKPRTIHPPEIAFRYLHNEKVRQSENHLRAGKAWSNPWNLVFTNEIGRYQTDINFYRHFKAIAARIGRPDARPHDLRHTCATVAIAQGSDVKSVQDLLGHATASFTLDRYCHTSDKMRQDTADRMQSYFDNLKKQA